MGIPILIYCAAGNMRFAEVALDNGWKYGARLPGYIGNGFPIYFADQDWKKPDLGKYLVALRKHRPAIATVLDFEREEQRKEVFQWAEEIAVIVSKIIMIPKAYGVIDSIPKIIAGAQIILGYSVRTTYGGTSVPLWEFGRVRPVHLLGGSTQKQFRLSKYLNVVSLDGGMPQQQANRCRYWSHKKGPNGHWIQLGTSQKVDANLTCFDISMKNIKKFWEAKYK